LLLGEAPTAPTREFWQWNFYVPHVGTNAAMRDGNWKLVRPMIAGTRFFNKDLYVGPEDEERTQAFIAADLKHKQDPSMVPSLLPVPRIRMPPSAPPELYNLADDPNEAHDLATAEPQRVQRMLRALETWFEDVEAERLTILGALRE
ncbi:MAG: hypothetical protein EBS65_16670, partial [Betaproteobacteria bacterium]|nr:hypothetical protein [Betaproteobacteria bacterium]